MKAFIPVSEIRLEPFGLEVRVPEGCAWEDIPEARIHAWLAEHRVVRFRGLPAMRKVDLPRAARRLGPLLAWPFGAINELRPDPDAKNYLYTNHEVPLHWDGAFIGRVPRYLFFHCVDACREKGGETVFVDTTRVWAAASETAKEEWRSLRFEYQTEKIAHYGGRFESPVVAKHPYGVGTVLRFAEPVDDLNPVSVHACGLSAEASTRRISELRHALAAKDATLELAWQRGDVVVADNHALLHGRRAFAGAEHRHIRRINVCGPERTWRDAVRDSLRIRRPEFMVAELPILLIPAFLVGFGRLSTLGLLELGLLFFLLFHFGDMINCLADRHLDAVYKTRLSEAIFGLGVHAVRVQIAATVLAACGLALHLAFVTSRPELLALVVFGLVLGAQYSVGPLRLKSRGLAQVPALWGVIFVGPMLLVARAMGAAFSAPLAVLILAYGMMQQGIILINTAEDLPEDEEYGIRTVAVSLGLRGCLRLSIAMVGVGGLGTIGALACMAGWVPRVAFAAIAPIALAWAWTLREVATIFRAAGLEVLRLRARYLPLWLTATAWTSLWASWWIGTEGLS